MKSSLTRGKRRYLMSQVQKMRSRIALANRDCLVAGCSDAAIMSHAVWRAGHIDTISEENHVFRINSESYSLLHGLKFEKSSTHKSLRFRGLCNRHDNDLFKPIERVEADLTEYKHQALIVLRGLFYELRKKIVAIEFNRELIHNDELLTAFRLNPYDLEITIRSFTLGIHDLLWYIKELNRDYLLKNRESFVFKYRVLPNCPIAAASVFDVESDQDTRIKSKTEANWEQIIPDLTLYALLPISASETMIIEGCHQNFWSNHARSMRCLIGNSEEHVRRAVGCTILHQFESWVCSPSLYRDRIQPKEKDYIVAFDAPSTRYTCCGPHLISLFT